jgi:hypothetical protein
MSEVRKTNLEIMRIFMLKKLLLPFVKNPTNIAMMSMGLTAAASSIRFRDLFTLWTTLKYDGVMKALAFPIFSQLPEIAKKAISPTFLRNYLLLSLGAKVFRVIGKVLVLYPIRLLIGEAAFFSLGGLSSWFHPTVVEWNFKLISFLGDSIQTILSGLMASAASVPSGFWYAALSLIMGIPVLIKGGWPEADLGFLQGTIDLISQFVFATFWFAVETPRLLIVTAGACAKAYLMVVWDTVSPHLGDTVNTWLQSFWANWISWFAEKAFEWMVHGWGILVRIFRRG